MTVSMLQLDCEQTKYRNFCKILKHSLQNFKKKSLLAMSTIGLHNMLSVSTGEYKEIMIIEQMYGTVHKMR